MWQNRWLTSRLQSGAQKNRSPCLSTLLLFAVLARILCAHPTRRIPTASRAHLSFRHSSVHHIQVRDDSALDKLHKLHPLLQLAVVAGSRDLAAQAGLYANGTTLSLLAPPDSKVPRAAAEPAELRSTANFAGSLHLVERTISMRHWIDQRLHGRTDLVGRPDLPGRPNAGASSAGNQQSMAPPAATAGPTADLFPGPISTAAPLPMFPVNSQHPVPRAGVVQGDGPVQTNKWGPPVASQQITNECSLNSRWYANLFLATRKQGAFSLPYMLWVTTDPGAWGLSISHTDPGQLVTGPDAAMDPVQYYLSPVGIRSMTLSARELDPSTASFDVDSPTSHSINLNMYQNQAQYGSNSNKLVANLVQGMGFVTGRYYGLTPLISSAVFFRSVEPQNSPRNGVQKWKATLEDGKLWIIYAVPGDGQPQLQLTLNGNSQLGGNGAWTGFIQIGKLGDASKEGVLDSGAGAFPVTTKISGNVAGTQGSYTLSHSRFGQNNAGVLLMYALPHHVASFDGATANGRTGLQLRALTKGMAEAVLSDKWCMVETGLPTDISWLPLNGALLSQNTQSAIRSAATEEVNGDIDKETNLDSMYFSGKAFGKYAQLSLVIALVLQDHELAKNSLERLKSVMNRFTSNKQQFPLWYDGTWKGIVSSASYVKGDPNADFGNSYYNDHHFHYGYFVYTAAVIGYLDQLLNNNADWLNGNKPWVNDLLRDVANPSDQDPYFPVSRSFDWWNGHSWAKGLYESADGKDQESSSEDYNFAYGMKMWGMVTGDASMEGRGNMMLAIMRRSMNMYFLLQDDNPIHPKSFLKNKVTGILFENKCDHATYFGLNPEYIQGIHMLPLTPVSPYVRQQNFCAQEWAQYFDNGRADQVAGGWRGVLFANQAIFDPRSSWSFFTQSNFDYSWIDGGASRTWYLTFAGGLGGAN